MPKLSIEKNPGWLGKMGDYTTHFYWDHKKPLQGSQKNNQYNGKTKQFVAGLWDDPWSKA